MTRIFTILVFLSFLAPCDIFPVLGQAQAQMSDTTDEQPRKKRRKRRKRKKNKQPQKLEQMNTDNLEAQSKDYLENAAEEKLKKEAESMLFPNWGTPSFDWYIDPIIGLSYTKYTNEQGSFDTVASEAGLALGLKGVPLIPSNPGLYISPGAGRAWGSVDTKDPSNKTTSVKYTRTFGNLSLVVPVYWYRHTLRLTRGVKEYSVDSIDRWQSFSVMNDFAVLILPVLSGHLTHTYLKAFREDFDKQNLLENDYWVHARFSTSVLKFFIDAGPGFTVSKEYLVEPGNHQEVADGQVDYFKLLTGLHLFWKFGMTGQAKYIYKSTDNNLGQYATELLPEESLNQPREQTMPEDSLNASLFFGARQILGGFGFGYQYYLQILNMNEKDGKKKETTRDQGFTITFDVGF